MPLGNDVRSSRRPMPRQMDMSSWGEDSSASVGSAGRHSGISDDVDYRKSREVSRRYDTLAQNDYHPRSNEGQVSRVTRESFTSDYSRYDLSSEGSESVAESTATTISNSGRIHPRSDHLISSYRSERDKRDRRDNQREVDDLYHSDRDRYASRDIHETFDRTDRSVRSNQRSWHESDDTTSTTAPTFTGTAGYFSSSTSYRNGRSYNDSVSEISHDKADSVRSAKSPSHENSSQRIVDDDDSEALELETSRRRRLSDFERTENQSEQAPPSPTNSEVSLPPTSPTSDNDPSESRANRSIPSPISSDRTTSTKPRASSPCSSVSTLASGSSLKQSTTAQRASKTAMSDLREELYAFRKQMREVFIRVEDMVDVHRSFFKSDPSTGSPVFNSELQREAEELANDTFQQLTDLRVQFSRLAKDFQRAEEPPNEWSSDRKEVDRRIATTGLVRSRPQQRTAPTYESDDESVRSKGSDTHGLKITIGEECPSPVRSTRSPPNTRPRRPPPSPTNSDDSPPSVMSDSMRSTATTNLTQTFSSRWREPRTSSSDISIERTSALSGVSSSISGSSSRQPKPADTDNIFKDFDKRMEEIRSSLNAIASGKKVAPSRKFECVRAEQESPIRTRPTLQEASRISSGAEVSRPSGNGTSREQELNQINSSE